MTAVLAVLIGFTATAIAHDEAIATNPEDGATLETVPETITIEFSNAPIALGSVVTIEDADGVDRAVGEVEIDGNAAVQAVDPSAPAGTYTVSWRVVSSDSHPIEGTFGFTAEDAAPDSSQAPEEDAASEPAPEESAAAEPATASQESVTADAPASDESAGAGIPAVFGVVLVVILVVLAGVAGVLLWRRRTS